MNKPVILFLSIPRFTLFASPPRLARATVLRRLALLCCLLATCPALVPAHAQQGADFSLLWQSTETDDTWPTVLGDVTGDGLMDQVVGNKFQPSRVYQNNGNGAFSLIWSSAEVDKTKSNALGDMDGDGDLDLAVGNYNTPSRIYANNGQGVFTLAWTSSHADRTRFVGWGDADRDGDLDLFVGNNGVQGNRVYRNDGGGVFTLSWTSTRLSRTRSLALGDADGDGDLDLLAGNYNQPNRLYKNNGGGAFALAWTSAEADATREVAFGDVDGDRDLDLLVGNFNQPNRVYLNDGQGQFTLQWTSAETLPTRAVALGDLDSDGDLDFAAANDGGQLTVYANSGQGGFASAWVSPESQKSRTLALGDADADGRLDLLAGNRRQANRLYRNIQALANTVPTAPALAAEPDHVGQTATHLVRLEWQEASDIQTPAGLLTYNLRVGTAPGGQDVMSAALPARPGNAGQRLFAKLLLPATAAGATYYWSVQAVDNTTFAASAFAQEDSFVVRRDLTDPGSVANLQDGGGFTSNTGSLSVTWTAAEDLESGIAQYLVSLGVTPGGAEVVAGQLIGVSTSHTFSGLNLTPGQTYYATVQAVNGVALTGSAVSTDGITVDTTPPPAVGGFAQTASPASTSTTELSLSWQPPAQTQDMDHYTVSLLDNVQTVVSQSVVTEPAVVFSNLTLTVGASYVVSVVSVDSAGNASAPVASAPILIAPPAADTTPPPCQAFADANGDCAFTQADVVALMQHLNGKITLADPVMAQMRVGGTEGGLSVDDVNLLMRCALGQLDDAQRFGWCPALAASRGGAP